MFSWIREKFGKVVIGSIISLIAFVFIFSGVFSPKATRGLHEGAVAGTVNGESISISEFQREFNRRVEFFKNIAGGKISDDQIQTFIRRRDVFDELANKKLMVQEAWKEGLVASDEEVKEKIQEVPAFQKDGRFDLVTYRQVLQQNNLTAGSFEKMVREDVSLQNWNSYFRDRIRVSEPELKKEFLLTQDKRNLKYVLLTSEGAKKHVPADKLDEIQKLNQKLADQVIAIYESKVGTESQKDAKANALLKPYDAQVKTTGFMTRDKTYIPGVGEAKDPLNEAFSAQSPIDLKQGGKPKKFQLADRVMVAWVIDAQKPDMAQFSKERDALMRQVMSKKMRDQHEQWMKKLTAKASIDLNPAVVSESNQPQ